VAWIFNLLKVTMYSKNGFMKTIFYKLMFTLILVGGIFIGMVKGEEAKQKWVNKKKIRYESRKDYSQSSSLVMLDEIEMATYHS
jgi:hypothetical protein